MTAAPATPEQAAAGIVHELLRDAAATVAVAESLTGGLLGGVLTAVAGSSATFRGGVISYATDVKATLLGVDPSLLERGAVQAEVAAEMAAGARRLLTSTYGVALTGVAGPDAQDGRAPGTVYAAVTGPAGVRVEELMLPGDRTTVRRGAVAAALELLIQVLREGASPLPR